MKKQSIVCSGSNSEIVEKIEKSELQYLDGIKVKLPGSHPVDAIYLGVLSDKSGIKAEFYERIYRVCWRDMIEISF